MTEQMNIFECLYPAYKITKPIRLIELFAGYGSQALALKYLGVPFEHWKICEWNYKSFQAYKDIHMPNDSTDYSAGLTKDELVDTLSAKGISSDWNKPMKYEQVKRLGESKLREIYNNIIATHNLVDVSSAHAEDLQIVEQDKYAYLLTYSFPCQDLSLAGLRQSMDRDSGTRSSLLWEVERILLECKEENCLPDVLLMENVPQVHGTENARNWREWLTELERLGYQSYWEDMIATDYGIPQIRNRTFCVSLLGEYSYNFPRPIKLTKRLKDLLEDKAADKYYLSKRMIDFFTYNSTAQKEKGNGFKFEVQNGDKEAKSITTRSGGRMDDNFVYNTDVEHYEIKPAHGYFPGSVKKADFISTIDACIDYQHIVLGEKSNIIAIDEQNKTSRNDGLIGTLTTDGSSPKHNNRVLIKNATEQGYLEAEPGDCVDISSRMAAHRGTVQKEKAQTLTTLPDRGVVVKKAELADALIEQGKVHENDVIRHSYTSSRMNGEFKDAKQNNICPTLDTRSDCLGVVNNLRIRKLTPKECFRLMGVKDAEFERVQRHHSDSTLYHLAGDSIVTTCLMAIFGELLGIKWQEKVEDIWK